ncbi:MAG: sigma-70 family RNA polymerase sigma factor [Gammaproteobacteria bacterium]|nr:sigma-70 family RNA polymerase sigma factor [Gammaproteobacteria bacterium]
MHKTQDYYPNCPEAMIVSLARTGDRSAFADLVRRRQSSIRNLMRRCSGDITLAEDLAQQVFIQVWLKIHTLKQASAFSAWLKRLAISVWLQYLRKNDALRDADALAETELAHNDTTSEGMDLDQALAALSNPVRLCIVLAYHEGMSHGEIADLMDMPLGTIKSHIKRGTERLQQCLSAYQDHKEKLQ